MRNYKIGFIGSGKMASAIINGLIKNKFTKPENIKATQTKLDTIDEKSKKLGIEIFLNNKKLVNFADVIVLAVKPNQIISVLDEVKDFINEKKLVISVAAGVSTKKIEETINKNISVVRVMPNTPVLINEGMTGIVGGKFAKNEDIEYVEKLFKTIGKTVVVNEENQIDIITAISGSGPAFFYKVINDIARAGEKLGLDYEKAILLSIQTAIGAAKMSLKREVSMEELISNVATSGGCTRVGIDCMEKFDTEQLFYEVIRDTSLKAYQLGQ